VSAADGTFGSPLPLAQVRESVPADLQAWCELANEAGWMEMGEPDTCVLTSHALAEYLRLMGREPQLVRVEAAAHPRCQRGTGVILGSEGDGTRRPAAGPGKWHGHLAVACDGHLLDPTIDQVNNELLHFTPLVFPLPSWWDEGRAIFFTDGDRNMLRYKRFYRQAGWKSAPDARPSHWRPVTALMVELAAGHPAHGGGR
jgi:hypothetical protein